MKMPRRLVLRKQLATFECEFVMLVYQCLRLIREARGNNVPFGQSFPRYGDGERAILAMRSSDATGTMVGHAVDINDNLILIHVAIHPDQPDWGDIDIGILNADSTMIPEHFAQLDGGPCRFNPAGTKDFLNSEPNKLRLAEITAAAEAYREIEAESARRAGPPCPREQLLAAVWLACIGQAQASSDQVVASSLDLGTIAATVLITLLAVVATLMYTGFFAGVLSSAVPNSGRRAASSCRNAIVLALRYALRLLGADVSNPVPVDMEWRDEIRMRFGVDAPMAIDRQTNPS